jgi:hypothetical protein
MILLPTLERLHPYRDGDQPAAGLVFATALDSSYGGDSKDWMTDFLRPWSWEDGGRFLPILQLKLYYKLEADSNTWLPKVVDLAAGAPANSFKKAGLAGLQARLNDRFEQFMHQEGEPWTWSVKSSRVRPSERPWPAFLGEVSLLPWPLAQALGMSFFHRFTDLPPKVTHLVGAPVLRLGPLGQDQVLEPGPPVERTDLGRGGWEMPYVFSGNSVTDLKITAVTKDCDLSKKPESGGFLDLGTLWVKRSDPKNPSKDIGTEDWREGLEIRLAAELNLARILTDWMRDQLKDGGTRAELVKTYPTRSAEVRRHLRNIAVPALGRDFVGGNLLRRIASRWEDSNKKLFLDEDIKKLEDKAQGAFESLVGTDDLSLLFWAAFPEGPRPVVADRDRAADQLGLEETLESLDQLIAAWGRTATVAPVFGGAWESIKDTEPLRDLSPGSRELLKALSVPQSVIGLDLAVELLRARVGQEWKDVLDPVFQPSLELAEARKKLGDGVEKKLSALLPSTPAATAWVKGRAKQIAENILPPPKPSGASGSGVRTTRGLSFQVDTLGQDPAQDGEDGDLLKEIQGIAILARKEGEEWRCLNLAQARIGELELAERVLLPSRLGYSDGLRTATLTYDNLPLTVAGPLGDDAASGVSLENQERLPLDEPLVDYGFSTEAKLPELVFGQKYEVLPFIVTNSGAIPEELAEGGPWKLRTGLKQVKGEAGLKRTAHYLRETHVGALRFHSEEPSGLPPIPAGVAPRVRELAVEAVLPKGDPLLARIEETKLENLKTDWALAGTPFLLLAPPPPDFPRRQGIVVRDRFEFQISPPTVDLQTWDRWVARTHSKDQRKVIWRSFYELAHKKSKEGRREKMGVNVNSPDVYLDDPAVDSLWLELVDLTSGVPVVVGTQPIDLQRKDKWPSPLPAWEEIRPSLGIRYEQHAPVKIAFEVNDKGRLTVRASDLPPLAGTGAIYRLSIYAVLKSNWKDQFLDPKECIRCENNLRATSPWHLLIEIPRRLAEKDDERQALRTALRASLTPDQPAAYDGRLRVVLDPQGDSWNLKRDQLHRAELWHQMWHWRGRPPQPHPYLTLLKDAVPKDAVKVEADVLPFEVSEFGERSDDGHRRLPMTRTAKDGMALPVFSYEENLLEQSLQGEVRALHHRFSARVFSRYEGLLPEEESFIEALDGPTGDRWRSLFVPCRPPVEVAAPKVKLVLPLTEGPEGGEGPGLMVVVDGPWYEVGGLAEALGVEVMTVSGPDGKDAQGKPIERHYLQIGTDPILTAKGAGESFGIKGALESTDRPRFNVEVQPITGAIGHQRDRSRTDPRFLASSFLLPRPVISDPKGGEFRDDPERFSWWFVQLRFYRKLALPSANPSKPNAVHSKPSAPFWVQYLPGVERIESDWFGDGQFEVRLDQGNLRVLDASGKEAAVTTGPTFYPFAVMTRGISDYAGRPDQEAYLGVWRLEDRQWKTDVRIESTADLYLRWIEVQGRKLAGINSGDELWKRIFDPGLPDSERARIVRMSKRFSIDGRRP